MISFITINYNGLDDTLALLQSLYAKVHSVDFEVIVVDNGSQEDEAQAIAKAYPLAHVIATGRNLGFAGGNNEGLKAARGEYLMLINNDTYIEEDRFSLLVEYMQKHPKTGALSPLICDAVHPPVVQWAGYTPLSAMTLRNHAIGQGDAPERHAQPSATAFCHGAAMLVSREALEKAGPMPTLYFLYYEEYDWCCRIMDAGYTLAFVPWQIIFHRESRATGIGSPLKTYYLSRGRLLFARRNRKGFTRLASCLYLSSLALLRNTIKNWRSPRHIYAAIRGTWHGLSDAIYPNP